MPTYDYVCSNCNYEFEHFQGMSDEHLKTCPNCEGEVKRKISGGTGLIFKGSGYYLTDYKKKISSATDTADKKQTTNKKEPKKTKEHKDNV